MKPLAGSFVLAGSCFFGVAVSFYMATAGSWSDIADRDMAWGALVHNCKALYGSSGAPLLIRDGSGYAIVSIHTGSMFASDSNGHVAQFVGNRAIRSRKFTQTLQALSTRLKRTPLDPDGSP